MTSAPRSARCMPRRSGARSASSTTRTPARSVYIALSALEIGLPPLGERAHPLLHVLAPRHERLRERLLLEAGLEAALVGALEEALREAERERGTVRQTIAPRARCRFEVGARHDLVAEAEPQCLIGGLVFSEEHELL